MIRAVYSNKLAVCYSFLNGKGKKKPRQYIPYSRHFKCGKAALRRAIKTSFWSRDLSLWDINYSVPAELDTFELDIISIFQL